MVGIKEVAKAAGVSDRTVSRVVHSHKMVDAVTRANVTRIIEELGYVPNRAARLIRSNRSGVVGLMTDVVATTPFSTDIVRGIQEAMEKTDYSLLTVNTGGDLERVHRSWQRMRSYRVEGVIFVTMFERKLQAGELDPSVKTVLVNCYPDANTPAPIIVPDEPAGITASVRAVLKEGHRKIGYVRINPEIMAAKIRERSLRRCLAENGITINEKWFVAGLEGPVFGDRFVAFENARALLQAEDRPSALFCGNDEIALQVFCAATSLGLRVPQDLSIVGFDDFKVVTEVMRPQLSTVALPYFEMGNAAVKTICSMLAGKEVSSTSKVECKFVPRETIATYV